MRVWLWKAQGRLLELISFEMQGSRVRFAIDRGKPMLNRHVILYFLDVEVVCERSSMV